MRTVLTMLATLALGVMTVAPLHASDADDVKRLTAENAALKAKLAELQNELLRSAAASTKTLGSALPSNPIVTEKPGTAATGSSKVKTPSAATASKDPTAAELATLRENRDTINAGLFTALQQLNGKLSGIATTGGTTVQNNDNLALAESIFKAAKLDNYHMAILARISDVATDSAGTACVKINGIEPLNPFPDAKPALAFSTVPGFSQYSPTSFGYNVLMTVEEARLLQKGVPVLIIVNQTIFSFVPAYHGPPGPEPVFAKVDYPGKGYAVLRAGNYVLQIGDRLYDSPWRHRSK